MADYYSPTVVLPDLPFADINPIELLLLTAMFDDETDGKTVYFFSEDGFDDLPVLEVDEARAALADSPDGRVAAHIRERLEVLEPDATDFAIEDDTLWEDVFQDIIRRSSTLHHIEVITSNMCSKMRPDGFGGAVTIITAERALSSSTQQMACELLDRAEFGDIARAPGFGSHVALRLDEADVRATLAEIFEAEAPAGMTIDEVSADDIRAACRRVLEQRDLSHEHGELAFASALLALRIAAERYPTAG